MKNKPKRIFTFWEPSGNLPAYLELCMETWKKYLPDYEIVVLDYKSLDKWLGKKYYLYDLYLSYTLPQQTDAIRAAILYEHGGMWLDCDTIITSDKIRTILEKDSETIFVGGHIAFIYSIKRAHVIKKWCKIIKRNLILAFLFKYFLFFRKIITFVAPVTAKFIKKSHWGFLGNLIVNPIISKAKKSEYFALDRKEFKIFPEICWRDENNLKSSSSENYMKFYFEESLAEYALENNGGMICLHNSWTPQIYKKMSREEFLKTECTLSSILKKVL